MKNIALCFLITLAFNFNSVSQNLVPNWSFEEVINCPSTLAALHNDCADWYFGIQIPGLPWNEWPSPDWFHSCAPNPGIAPPNTVPGYQEPCEGEGYAGCLTFDLTDPNYREIISVELLEQTTVGEIYSIRFQIARAHSILTGYASNNMGFRFTTFPFWLSHEDAITNWAHFKFDQLIEDSLNWTLIEFDFVADSVYNYFHIGNFFTDDNTTLVNILGETFAVWAYYFVDCVEVIKNEISSASLPAERISTTLYPNPAVDFITIPNEVLPGSVKILTSMGRMVINAGKFTNAGSTIDISKLSEGLYIVEIEDDKNKITSFKLIKTK